MFERRRLDDIRDDMNPRAVDPELHRGTASRVRVGHQGGRCAKQERTPTPRILQVQYDVAPDRADGKGTKEPSREGDVEVHVEGGCLYDVRSKVPDRASEGQQA